jgi:alpha-1,2-mannosyltransferase
MLIVVLVLVLGLTIATLAYRRLGDRWGLPACAVTGLLSSPIAWSHHWVWCVPIVALLWVEARRWVIPAVLIFWSFAVWAVPHQNGEELHFSVLQIALSEWYIVFGLGFLALTAYRVRSR